MTVAPRGIFLFACGIAVVCQEDCGLELGPTLWIGPDTIALRQDEEERKPRDGRGPGSPRGTRCGAGLLGPLSRRGETG